MTEVVEAGTTQAAGALREFPAWVFVGGYAGTDTPSSGIASVGIDPANGEPRVAGMSSDVPNPFHLHVAGDVLYAASNVAAGAVHALRIGEDGSLTELGRASTDGAGTVHLTVSPDGGWLLAANHDSASVAVLPIRSDGTLGAVAHLVRHTGSGPDAMAQAAPHPHAVVFDPTGERVLVPDKGNDRVYVYGFDAATGVLTEQAAVEVGSGVGPRALVCHPDGAFVYVITELASTIVTCAYADGELRVLDSVSTVPEGTDMWHAAAGIAIAPDGAHVYAANRGHESVAVFDVTESGTLRQVAVEQVGQPVTTLPWDIALEPGGRLLYVVNQLAGQLVAYRVAKDGTLERAEGAVSIPTPVGIALA